MDASISQGAYRCILSARIFRILRFDTLRDIDMQELYG